MARPDFENVWGSTNAPFTAITDTDYKAGWVFRTGAPPRRVNFDYFQNLSDQRTAWLGGQMLLAVGHEWQDDVTYDEYAVVRSPVNGQLYRSLVGTNLGNEPSVSGAQWALGVADSVDLLNAPIATVAAGGTIDLTAVAPDTSQLAINGSGVSINSFIVAANRFFVVKVETAQILVNSASLVTGRGQDIPVAAGDSFLMRSTAANVVEVLGGDFLIDRGIGSGQTWQDFTGAPRVLGVTYTNTTGRAITVAVALQGGTGPESATVTVGGVLIFAGDPGYGTGFLASFPVPAGNTYVVTSNATGGYARWTELR